MQTTLNSKWSDLIKKLETRFGDGLDLQSILFLVGIQELGMGYQKLGKNQKIDVIHIAVCALLSQWGYYEFDSYDKDGWPHWKATEKIPSLEPKQQETLIKEAIIEYFS